MPIKLAPYVIDILWLLVAASLIPLVPNEHLDPWGIFNPRRLVMVITLIAVIQWIGSVASRLFGRRLGMSLLGFLSGLLSSTAAFVSFPRQAKRDPQSYYPIASAASLAIAATLLQLVLLLSAISWRLAVALAIPLMAIIVVCVGLGVLLSLKHGDVADKEEQENPLSILGAIKLGCLLTALIFIVELSQKFLGPTLTHVVTFLGALFELQGVAIASANMLANQTIALEQAANTVMLAVVASMVSKIALTIIFAEAHYRTIMLYITTGLLLLSISFWLLVSYWPFILLQI